MSSELNIPAALAYSAKHAPRAILVARGDATVASEYAAGVSATTPHPLYSGTKSFWGPAALFAQEEGLLALDEPVAESFAQWRDDPWKRGVTLRMLLSLTAGFGFGGLGAAVPTYERALAMPLKDEPGARFTYGGIPFQVFGAVLAHKLARKKSTPHEYLRERITDPAGVTIGNWRTLSDGTHPLPTGASLSAESWLAYGRFVLRERQRLAAAFTGSAANARYGLGWWLSPKNAPADLIYASGSAGQALYLVPSFDLVVVRFGKSASYRHESFLKQLFS
jgi:CubicO group peptidase (beta-lactamase class C family)